MSQNKTELAPSPRFWDVIGWIWKGKSVTRSMMNCWLTKNSGIFKGTIYDLGGAGRASFMDVVTLPPTYVTIDMMADAKPTIVADIEKPLPVEDCVADTVVLFNTLEHVYDFQHVVNEMFRLTKPGGSAISYSPMMVGFHTHKGDSFFIDDYFRYTRSALQRIFTNAGFADVKITPQGGLGWVLADLAMIAVKVRPLRLLVALLFGGFERLTARHRGFDSVEKFALAYFVEAKRL